MKYEQQRWAAENQRDECFADMYVHPQEIDYNCESLFQLIDASGLAFLGFSNPEFWNLERLVGNNPMLMARAEGLGDRQRYRLIELLDPNVTHYEFFLGKPPLAREEWQDDRALATAKARRNPCLHGWPSQMVLSPDYRPIHLSEAEFAFMQACDAAQGQAPVAELLQGLGQELGQDLGQDHGDFAGGGAGGMAVARSLWAKRLILLAP